MAKKIGKIIDSISAFVNEKTAVRSILLSRVTDFVPEDGLLFYKYSPDDVVEISFFSNDLNECLQYVVYIHVDIDIKDKLKKIIDNKHDDIVKVCRKYKLEEKRFLFNLSTFLPVKYNDFIEMDIPEFGKNSVLFIPSMETNDKVIIGSGQVLAVTPHAREFTEIERATIYAFNELKNVGYSKNPVSFGSKLFMILAGKYRDIDFLKFKDEMLAPNTDFSSAVYRFSIKDISGKRISPIMRNLPINNLSLKLTDIYEKKEVVPLLSDGEFTSDEISFQSLIEIGVDTFLGMIKNPQKKIIVKDITMQEIYSMYIRDGSLWIAPSDIGANRDTFETMFDTSNIQLIFY